MHTDVLNAVAAERLYLSAYGGFTVDGTSQFHQMCDAENYPHLLVVDDNDIVVGWCDIVTRNSYPRQVGFLGVGLLPEFREHGLGKKLITSALKCAAERGFREIRLECRADNKRAIHVYKQLGFKKYASRRNALIIGNDKYNLIYMKKRLSKEGI